MSDQDYSGPTSQEPKPVDPGVYEEANLRPRLQQPGTVCPSCGRPMLGYTMEPRPEIGAASWSLVFVHPQKPNGQPDICRKG